MGNFEKRLGEITEEKGGSEQACNLLPSSSGIWAFLIRLLFCKEREGQRGVVTSAAEANVFWEPSKIAQIEGGHCNSMIEQPHYQTKNKKVTGGGIVIGFDKM